MVGRMRFAYAPREPRGALSGLVGLFAVWVPWEPAPEDALLLFEELFDAPKTAKANHANGGAKDGVLDEERERDA